MKKGFQKIIKKIMAMPKRMLGFLVCAIVELPQNILKLLKLLVKIGKKIIFAIRNPKLVWQKLVQTFKSTKRFLKRLPKLTREYFFLIVMSAENNVYRLKRRGLNDIPSLAEFKTYQKHLRKKTFSIAMTGALTIMLIITLPGLFQKYFAQSKGYQWIQTEWQAGSTALTTSALTGWQKYSSRGPAATAIETNEGTEAGTDGQLALHNFTSQTAQENTSGTYSAGVYSGGNYSGVNSATNSGVYSKSNTVTLKKPAGTACGGNEECISGDCTSNACFQCGVSTVSRTDNSTTFTYGTVVGADTKCWLDRNLGATSYPYVATDPTDVAIYGWYFQWGRGVDGHQNPWESPGNVVVQGPISAATATNGNFVKNINTPADWISPQNNTFWQGVNGTNNPCPAGFRPATTGEWANLLSAPFVGYPDGILDGASAWASSLKIPMAGGRGNDFGSVNGRGSQFYHWTSSTNGSDSYVVYYTGSAGSVNNIPGGRAPGYSVRCIKN